jgi:hypothetical protein
MSHPVCKVCDDTHDMWLYAEERYVMCTHCPVPCQNCRRNWREAYCAETPCKCRCHVPNDKVQECTNDNCQDKVCDQHGWYVGPLTKERIADLRHKLAKARGLLVSFTDPDPQYHPTVEEVRAILDETGDP